MFAWRADTQVGPYREEMPLQVYVRVILTLNVQLRADT